MDIRFGLDAKLYYGTAGSTASTLLNTVREATLTLEKNEGDISHRGSGGWALVKGGLKSASVEFDLIMDTEDTGYAAMVSAWSSGTPKAFLVVNKENGQGIDADFEVLSISRSEPLNDAQTVSVTVKPTAGRVPALV